LPVTTLHAGEGFGEIALLRSVPRTATVTAEGDVELYTLDRDDFLPAVVGHSGTGLVTRRAKDGDDGTLVAALGAVPLLARLEPDDLARLAARAARVRVRRDTDIVREGDHGQRFYVLLTGTAEVVSNGTKRHVLGPGDSFGEIAVMRNVPRTATVHATDDVELCAIDREDLLGALGLDATASERALVDELV